MPDIPDKPQQDPVEGSREVIDKELAKQGEKGQGEKRKGGHSEIAGTDQAGRAPASNQNEKR